MNRFFLITSVMALFASTAFAQDDMYFTPRKKTAEEKAKEAKMKEMREAYVRNHVLDNTFYIGSSRDIDEYNRRGKAAGTNASAEGNDVIDFQTGTGEYPDTLAMDTMMLAQYNDSLALLNGEFEAKERSRFNDYNDYAYDADDFIYSRRLHGFYDYYGPYWGPWRHTYYDPWYYGYYDPFYDPWYDPWYYGYGYYGYAGWYDPWYYGSWRYPYYYGYGWGPTFIGGGHIVSRPNNVVNGPRTVYGTANHNGSRNVAYAGNNAGTRVATRGTRNMTSSIASHDRVNNRTTQPARSIYNTNTNTNRTTTTTTNTTSRSYSAPSTSSFSSGGGSSFGGGGGGSISSGARGGGGHGGRR